MPIDLRFVGESCKRLNPHLFGEQKNRKRVVDPKKKRYDEHEKLFEILWKASPINYRYQIVPQQYFIAGRNYRADFVVVKRGIEIPIKPADQKIFYKHISPKIIIECDGGIFMEKSGHSSISGLLKDRERDNISNSLGWTVYRIVCSEYKGVPKIIFADHVIDLVTNQLLNN